MVKKGRKNFKGDVAKGKKRKSLSSREAMPASPGFFQRKNAPSKTQKETPFPQLDVKVQCKTLVGNLELNHESLFLGPAFANQ